MQIPQLNSKTQVSYDYWNEYYDKVECLKELGLPALVVSFKKKPIKKYQERFPETQYDDVVTLSNKLRVTRLNELARIVNDNFLEITPNTEKNFKIITNKVWYLLFYIKRFPAIYPKV